MYCNSKSSNRIHVGTRTQMPATLQHETKGARSLPIFITFHLQRHRIASCIHTASLPKDFICQCHGLLQPCAAYPVYQISHFPLSQSRQIGLNCFMKTSCKYYEGIADDILGFDDLIESLAKSSSKIKLSLNIDESKYLKKISRREIK